MSGNDVPSVDILLPVRSPAPWLVETLAGLAAQTMSDWRLVAVIHGDAEGLVQVIRSATPDALIVSADSALTLPEVLNLGLASCTAPYVARIDADDVPRANRLQVQAEFLRDHPDVSLVASPVAVMDESGAPTGRVVGPRDANALVGGLRWKCVIQHPSVMFRRQSVTDLGGYDARALHVEDYELWPRLASVDSIDTVDSPLTDYRIHAGQVTRTKVIGRPARSLVSASRVRLARHRHESVAMAHLRQFVWASRQVVREWGSRTH